ncbi:MAG: DUF3859 domain-containing protein, partial [Chthoniobacterales bacterium]|nr:DUF3859 domain-containing protein [Chthoniobacterales bacterium]
PDLFDGPFTRFDKWTANCSPWVIFRGYAEDGYEGLFAMHVERNELFLLLDTHSELGGKKASGFEISSTPKLGEDLVLAIGFTDGSSGIYILKFGDGWGKAVFRRASEKADSASPAEAERGAGILQNFSGAGVVDAPPVPAGSAVRTQAEFIEEGSFRLVGAAEAHEEPLAASGKATPYSDAKLIEAGSVFPARQGLFFGYRYKLRAEGGDRCYVEGFDTRIIHPPMRGPNGKEQTESIVPLHVCFEDGKAEDFLTYGLEEDFEMLPGQWMLQVRKDGEVLVSRTFTIL